METYEIDLMDLNSSDLLPVTVIQRESASTGEFILEVTVNGIPYQGVSEFFFPAFQLLRDELLSIGYGMNCCGALPNAHQSPMMSVCDKIYLKRQLLATHPHILAECALRDKIWGIGMTMHDEYRFEPDLWEGQNLLGFALMTVRQELAQEL